MDLSFNNSGDEGLLFFSDRGSVSQHKQPNNGRFDVVTGDCDPQIGPESHHHIRGTRWVVIPTINAMLNDKTFDCLSNAACSHNEGILSTACVLLVDIMRECSVEKGFDEKVKGNSEGNS